MTQKAINKKVYNIIIVIIIINCFPWYGECLQNTLSTTIITKQIVRIRHSRSFDCPLENLHPSVQNNYYYNSNVILIF